MKQPIVPLALPPISEQGLSKSYLKVTENELIYQLERSSRGAHMLSQQKIDFLCEIHVNQVEMIKKAALLDTVMGGNIATLLRDQIPSSITLIKRKSNNSQLAKYIVRLFKPLHLLRDYLQTQFDDTEDQNQTLTRQASQHRQEKKCKIMTILDKSHELFSNLEKDAVSRRVLPAEMTLCKPIKLTNEQRDFTFTPEQVPVIEKYKKCVMCDHECVNLPPTNLEIDTHNKQQEVEYQRKLKLFENNLKAAADGRHSQSAPTRRPYRRNFKQPILMCMCSKSYCLGDFSGGSDGCPIKCNLQNGQRYCFEGVPKSCSCPICKCKCSFACHISDIDKLILARKVNGPETLQKKSSFDYSTTTPNFLRNIMSDAFQFGIQNHQKEVLKSTAVQPSVEVNTENQNHLLAIAASSACHNAALNIVTDSQKLTLKDRKELRKGLGVPNTKVRLPSGNQFDTKTLVGSPDKHASNNRLNTRPDSKVGSYSPGMRTRLDIDYGDICSSFDDVIRDSNKSASKTTKECTNVNSSLKTKEFAESKCDIKQKKSHAMKETIELLDSSSSEDENVLKIKKMHQRMVKRARRNISQSVENRLSNDNEDKKKETSKWKKTVRKLLHSKDNGTHLDIMKNVTTTEEGNLLDADNPPSSQDMLSRVSVYYDTD